MALTPLSNLVPDNANPSVTLGTIRPVAVPPKYDFSLLKRALTNVHALPNPNRSPGCSPILREFLIQTGVAFGIKREVSSTGGHPEHSTGNALDITAPAGSLNVGGALADIVHVLSPDAQMMFIRVVHKDTQFSVDNISYSADGASSAQFWNSTSAVIHLDSTIDQIRDFLYSPSYASSRAALISSQTSAAPFGARSVNYDGSLKAHNTGANSSKQGDARTTFW